MKCFAIFNKKQQTNVKKKNKKILTMLTKMLKTKNQKLTKNILTAMKYWKYSCQLSAIFFAMWERRKKYIKIQGG